MRLLELGNGVRLTWPSHLEIEDFYTTLRMLDSTIDPPNKVFISHVYRRSTDGTISSTSSGSGTTFTSSNP